MTRYSVHVPNYLARGLLYLISRLVFKLTVVEGKGNARHQAMQANAEKFTHAIASLVLPEYYGVYRFSGESA